MKFLFHLFLFGGLLGAGAAMAQRPQPVYVIIHGAWGGGWSFKKVDSILTAKGCLVYRPTLTGQGERVHLSGPEVGLQTHINDVVNTVLFEDLRDIILVGHSYGGMVITGVADTLPDRIRAMIYVDAMFPHDGENVIALSGGALNGIEAMAQEGKIPPPWLKPGTPLPHDVPQPLKTFTDTLHLNQLRSPIPATYVLTVEAGTAPEKDAFFPQSERARKDGLKVMQLTADHNPQLTAVDSFSRMLYELR